MTARRTIHVHPSVGAIDPVIGAALARLTPVDFADCPNLAACKPGDVVLSLSGAGEVLAQAMRTGLRCFHVAKGAADSTGDKVETRIQFGTGAYLDRLLRGRRLAHKPLAAPIFVLAEAGDEVLARKGERPVWIHRKTGGGEADIVSVPLPQLSGEEQPFDYLDGIQFIQLLPVLHFLRQVTEDLAWTRPPCLAIV